MQVSHGSIQAKDNQKHDLFEAFHWAHGVHSNSGYPDDLSRLGAAHNLHEHSGIFGLPSRRPGWPGRQTRNLTSSTRPCRVSAEIKRQPTPLFRPTPACSRTRLPYPLVHHTEERRSFEGEGWSFPLDHNKKGIKPSIQAQSSSTGHSKFQLQSKTDRDNNGTSSIQTKYQESDSSQMQIQHKLDCHHQA